MADDFDKTRVITRKDSSYPPPPDGGKAVGGASSRPPRGGRLVDLASPFLVTCTAIRRAESLGQTETLKTRAEELRAEFETAARDANYTTTDVQEALFAIGAFCDESVMSKARMSESWVSRKIMQAWFGTNIAGAEFFDHLAELQRERDKRAAPLQVYAATLALGFIGKYVLNLQELPALLAQVWIDVDAVSPPPRGPLAPRSVIDFRPPPKPVPGVSRRMMWIAFAASLVLLWILFSAMSSFSAHSVASSLHADVSG